jgi:4-aminobutyrate aminotransferase-like enzyme
VARARPFEERVLDERRALRGDADALRQRIEQHARGPRSKEILLATLDSEAAGHLPWASFLCPPVIERGEGAVLWDVDGNEYVDCQAGFAVCAVGHGNLEVAAAIERQLRSVSQYAELPLQVRANLSRRMAATFPGGGPAKVFHGVTGGEAIEIAMKLARWYTGKPIILTQYGDYHGRTAGAMGMTSKAFMVAYQWPVPAHDTSIHRFPFAYCYRCPYDKTFPECDVHCVTVLERQFENKEAPFRNPRSGITNVAAILIEPFQSSAGYIIPPPEYLQRLAALADTYEVLFAVDEVQSGMGRTGKMWAIEHAGVKPDLLVTGKAIANGLPVSMVIGDPAVLDSVGPGGHSTTFAGYAAAAAGGNAVLDIFERDNLLARVDERGAYFLDGLRTLQAEHPIIGDVQGKGLFLGVELVTDRETKLPAADATAWAHQELVNQGVVCMSSGYYGNRLMLAPPLVIGQPEIDRALSAFDRVLGAAERRFDIAGRPA